MKSSPCSDEIFGVPPQMNLNPSFSPREAGFHHEVISSHVSGIYPVRKDGFSRKKPSAYANGFFLRGHKGSNSGPTVLETAALPAELYPHVSDISESSIIIHISLLFVKP